MLHDKIVIEPYPGARTRWDYFQAGAATTAIQQVEDPTVAATILTRFIFETHPDVLDLPPAVLHRFEQSQKAMGMIAGSSDALHEGILGHFQNARAGFEQGYTLAETAGITRATVNENGKLARRITLPDQILHRALAWNAWAQEMIEGGTIDELFSLHPNWVGVKLGEGSWLQTGNLMIEVVEGLARIRTSHHARQDAEERLGVGIASKEWSAGLDQWFVMTHIADKELLRLAVELDPDMIDGCRLTPKVYAKSYRAICELINANPELAIRGVLSDGTWAYSADVPRHFPDQPIAQLHGIAGTVVEIGTAAELNMPEQASFATHDPKRRAAFQAGTYPVGIAARFIDQPGMEQVMQRFDSN